MKHLFHEIKDQVVRRVGSKDWEEFYDKEDKAMISYATNIAAIEYAEALARATAEAQMDACIEAFNAGTTSKPVIIGDVIDKLNKKLNDEQPVR